MFDISWTEFLLIAVVALIVIGPKELPAVMRTLGQWTRKVRSMAADFQNQFQEAMREAEMADLKKQVDDMAHDVTQFDPLKGVRDDIESMGKDFERSLDRAPEQKPALRRRRRAGGDGDGGARRGAGGRAGGGPLSPQSNLPSPRHRKPLRDQAPRETESVGAGAQTGPPEIRRQSRQTGAARGARDDAARTKRRRSRPPRRR